jgi:branched-chain amino acid transport system permease protein
VIRLGLRRDHEPDLSGLLGAVIGPLIVVGLVTLLAALVYADETMTEIVLLFGINAIMVVGFQIFVGNTGIVSFGHIAFMAVGAYAAGIAAMPVSDKELFLPDLPGFLAGFDIGIVGALLIGGVVAALVALITGVALMRLSGAAASIATLGLLVIVNNVIANAHSITRGPQSLFAVPDYTNFFWVFISLAVVVVMAGLFKWSKLGLRARAVRDDAIAAESAGVPLLRARLWAFVLSAFVTGVGGGLYAMLLTAFSPASFFLPQLVVVVTMAIIGGINSITGAVTGAAVITVLTEFLRRVENGVDVVGVHLHAATGISAAILGLALILMLRWRPAGLLGAAELQLERPGGGGRLGAIKARQEPATEPGTSASQP